MSISLPDFMKNLENLSKDPIGVLQDNIKKMVFLILREMAEKTIVDTGRARSLIIKRYADKYGMSVQEFENEYYGFWGNLDRDFDGKGSTMSDSWGKKSYKVDISANDEALFKQEKGVLNPSEIHSALTGRDNTRFLQRHLTFVADMCNRGAWDEIDGLEEEIDKLASSVENYLFTGKVK